MWLSIVIKIVAFSMVRRRYIIFSTFFRKRVNRYIKTTIRYSEEWKYEVLSLNCTTLHNRFLQHKLGNIRVKILLENEEFPTKVIMIKFSQREAPALFYLPSSKNDRVRGKIHKGTL